MCDGENADLHKNGSRVSIHHRQKTTTTDKGKKTEKQILQSGIMLFFFHVSVLLMKLMCKAPPRGGIRTLTGGAEGFHPV